MRYQIQVNRDGSTLSVPVEPRWIVNETPYYLSMDDLEDIMQVWERSPCPPTRQNRLTVDGCRHAQQQALKERLRAKWAGR